MAESKLPNHIVQYPDPRLRQKCALIEAFDEQLATLAARMLDLMRVHHGVGLAGPQVGDTLLFRLHEGTIVHGERSDSGWKLISLQDGKRGWIKDAELGVIVDSRLRPKLIPW